MGHACSKKKNAEDLEQLRAERERRLGMSLDGVRSSLRSCLSRRKIYPDYGHLELAGGKKDRSARPASSLATPGWTGPMLLPAQYPPSHVNRLHSKASSISLRSSVPPVAHMRVPTSHSMNSFALSPPNMRQVGPRGPALPGTGQQGPVRHFAKTHAPLGQRRPASAPGRRIPLDPGNRCPLPRRESFLTWDDRKNVSPSRATQSVSPILLRQRSSEVPVYQRSITPQSKASWRRSSPHRGPRGSSRHNFNYSRRSVSQGKHNSRHGSSASVSSDSSADGRFSVGSIRRAPHHTPVRIPTEPGPHKSQGTTYGGNVSHQPAPLKPVMRQALNFLAAEEVHDRAQIAGEELDALCTIQGELRYAMEMENIRIAAFETFSLEKRSRVAVSEQERVERDMLMYWLSQTLEEARLEELLRETQARQASVRSSGRASVFSGSARSPAHHRSMQAAGGPTNNGTSLAPSPLPPPPASFASRQAYCDPWGSSTPRHERKGAAGDHSEDDEMIFVHGRGPTGTMGMIVGAYSPEQQLTEGRQPATHLLPVFHSGGGEKQAGMNTTPPRAHPQRGYSYSTRAYGATAERFNDVPSPPAAQGLDRVDEQLLESKIQRQRELLEGTRSHYAEGSEVAVTSSSRGPSRHAPRPPSWTEEYAHVGSIPSSYRRHHRHETERSEAELLRESGVGPNGYLYHSHLGDTDATSAREASELAIRRRLAALSEI